MSDTPRTDKLFGGFAATDDGYWKVLDHARQLERELAAAKQRIVECEMVMAHRYRVIERQEPRCIEANARENALRNELAAANAEADTARLDWLFQDAELNLFFADRAEIDAAMKDASK